MLGTALVTLPDVLLYLNFNINMTASHFKSLQVDCHQIVNPKTVQETKANQKEPFVVGGEIIVIYELQHNKRWSEPRHRLLCSNCIRASVSSGLD